MFSFAVGTVAMGQSSSNTCTTTNLSYQYPVTAACSPLAFNKPTSYTATYNPLTCNANLRDDAYGWFQATSTQTTVQYTPTGGADAILHVLGGCGGPVLACSDGGLGNEPETVTLTTVIGTKYVVRVQRYNSNTAMNGTLCIYNTSCRYTLTLLDSYGDGWSDFSGVATAQILVNNASLGYYTLPSGSSGSVTFGVNDGDDVQVIYDDGWALFYDENSMELSVGGDCLFHTYEPPNIGLAYSLTADCSPSPAAKPQDCAGGMTLCTTENLTNTSTHTGCNVDLNAANSGCLLAGERQGTWYYFSASHAGSLGFTITPSGSIDYDFALWGPFASAQCPSAAPLRCSFADGLYTPTYLTGMGNGAADNSEGASGNGWVAPINVTAGQVYVLFVDNFSSTGQNFTLAWTLSGGASLNCTVLPVELLEFSATANKPVIDVEWATATEHNSDYFTVERSLDNTTFEPIGQVAAAGDATQRNAYRFADTRPAPGLNYYRLLQVDRNGATALSHVVVANMEDAEGKPLLYPNPVVDLLNVQWPEAAEAVALIVRDALGRAVLVTTPDANTKGNWQVPVEHLSTGCYTLGLALPNGDEQQAGVFLKR
ncbi:MAG: T9SS type A sorting domain-containing protein [Flavobacteriales bacterium]|jgi:hypothetical protein